jgi:hypothetical protein
MSITTCLTLVQALGEKLVQASRLAPPPVVTSAWRALDPSVAWDVVYERVQLATAAQEPFSVAVSKFSMSSVQGVAAETVAVDVEVIVGVSVTVAVRVGVAVIVSVEVHVGVSVIVEVDVKVSVGPPTVLVMVGVDVIVDVVVAVRVKVVVGDDVAVGDAVCVEELTGVAVKVPVLDEIAVAVKEFTGVKVWVGGNVGLAT